MNSEEHSFSGVTEKIEVEQGINSLINQDTVIDSDSLYRSLFVGHGVERSFITYISKMLLVSLSSQEKGKVHLIFLGFGGF
jgi:hypothetical protein